MLHYLYLVNEVFTIRTTEKTIHASRWQISFGKVMGWAIPSYITTKNSLCPM